MKRIITLMVFFLIETGILLLVIMLYQSNKQILIANEVFANTIETLRSRNFSQLACTAIQANEDYKFQIEKITMYKYRVTMGYELDFQEDSKSMRAIVYIPK